MKKFLRNDGSAKQFKSLIALARSSVLTRMLSHMVLIGGFLLGLICICKADSGYNVVTMSTAAPTGTEQAFLNTVKLQFNANIVSNPIASNTYAIKIFGSNSGSVSSLEQALSLGATVYVYGFANGQSYAQHQDSLIVEGFELDCSTPVSNFQDINCDVPLGDDIQWPPGTWNPTVCEAVKSSMYLRSCQAVTQAIDSTIFQESLSTPTVIPPGGF